MRVMWCIGIVVLCRQLIGKWIIICLMLNPTHL